MRTGVSIRLRPGRSRRAFTVIEMLVSIAIMTVLVVGVSSAIMLATRAAEGAGRRAAVAEAAQVIDQITAELTVALSFSERTSTAVTFTVPDRDGDDAPETIRYAWSGSPGAPLMRQYNGGTSQPVLQDVHYFCLSYLLKALTPAAG